MAVLGPVIENLLGVLKLKLKRIYGILLRKGFIDPPPKSLRGPISLDFISALAMAQKASVSGGMEHIAGLVGNLAPVFPEAKDLLDVDTYLRTMNNVLCNPNTILRSAKDVAAIRQQNAQKQAAESKMNMMHSAATTAGVAAQAGQTLAQTNVGGGQTALQQMLTGSGA